LTAADGRIALASVQDNTEVAIAASTQGIAINLSGVAPLGNIHISDQSILDVSGPAGGAIFLRGQTVHLDNQSALLSDTLGDLNGHRIQILADHVLVDNGSFIGAATFGSGAGSAIDITATQDVQLLGTNIFNFKNLQALLALGLRQISDRQIGGIFTSTVGSGQAGNISLNSRAIQIDQGAAVSADSLGTGDSGDIEIEAVETLRVRGSGITTNSLVPGVPLFDQNGIATGLSTIGIPAGTAGDISIDVAHLLVEAGAIISTATVSDQNSGDILINAEDAVILRDFFQPIPFPTAITTATVGGNGNGGNIYLETGRLVVQDGSEIAASTGSPTFQGIIPFGGTAGSLLINATESIDVIGNEVIPIPVGNYPIRVHPSRIESATFSDSSAGVIQLITPRLTVQDGGRISSATFGNGAGGEVAIDAETIAVSGAGGVNNEFVSGIFASSGASAQDCLIDGCIDPLNTVETFPVFGAGGTVRINTRELSIQAGAEVSVGSFSFGSAGNLAVSANTIRLNDRGSLAATTTTTTGGDINVTSDRLILDNSSISTTARSGNGGNLTFNIQDILLLRNGSLISTDAGSVGAGGNGGNITLNLPNGFIVAVPTENSDIRANAFEGDGGNVNITARQLLGIAFRPDVLDTPLSDITASSQFGNSGSVIINELTPDITPEDATLPTEIAPPALAQGCRTRGSQTGSFVNIGRGGLPASPTDSLSDDTVWQDLAPITISLTSPSSHNQNTVAQAVNPPRLDTPNPMVEAQSWIRTRDGTVILVAQQQTTPNVSVSSGC
jgi:large exoprotein involved in heme utilization and adhesion